MHGDLGVTYFHTKESQSVHLFATLKKRKNLSAGGLEAYKKEFDFWGKRVEEEVPGAGIQVRPVVL